MDRSGGGAPSSPEGSGAGRRVGLIGALSGLLYAASYLAQAALFLAGRSAGAGEWPLGGPLPAAVLPWSVAAYAVSTLGLFLLYAWLLALCRAGRLRDGRARRLAFLCPLLFNLGLLAGRPYLSIDPFSYYAHGYLGLLPGGNPYQQPAGAAAETPLGPRLAAYGWAPVHDVSPYGPLWTGIEVAVARLIDDPRLGVLALKAVVVAASLGAGALIYLILGRVRPADQMLGTLTYLWNPLIVMEFAADGHNDALMIFFTLAGLALAVAARPAAAIVALILGALVKYLSLLLLPALLVTLWRQAAGHPRRRLAAGWGLLLGAALAALLYQPFWAGVETFAGVRLASAGRPAQDLRVAAFLLGVLLVSLWARDAERLLIAGAAVMLGYGLIVAVTPWPWYLALPLALLALLPPLIAHRLVLALPLCARLAAPVDVIYFNGLMTEEAYVFSLRALQLGLLILTAALLPWGHWRRQQRQRRGE